MHALSIERYRVIEELFQNSLNSSICTDLAITPDVCAERTQERNNDFWRLLQTQVLKQRGIFLGIAAITPKIFWNNMQTPFGSLMLGRYITFEAIARKKQMEHTSGFIQTNDPDPPTSNYSAEAMQKYIDCVNAYTEDWCFKYEKLKTVTSGHVWNDLTCNFRQNSIDVFENEVFLGPRDLLLSLKMFVRSKWGLSKKAELIDFLTFPLRSLQESG